MRSKRNALWANWTIPIHLDERGKKDHESYSLFIFFSYGNVWYVWIWIFALEEKNHCVLVLVFWLTPDITLLVPVGFIHFDFFVFCKMLSVRHGLVWRAHDHRRVAGFTGHTDAQGGDFQATSFHLHKVKLPNQALFWGSRVDCFSLQVKLTLSLTFKHTYFLWKSKSLPNHHGWASDSSVQLFATPWIAARQASLSITNSRSLLKLMSIELVMLSNHLFPCHPFLPPSIFLSIRVFSKESVLCIRGPKYKQSHISQNVLAS